MANRITFRFNTDRICIWKNTILSLGKPQYIHLLINEKEKQMFIQVCDHDKDAFRLYYNKRENGRGAEFHVNAKRLMKYLAILVGVDYNGPSIRFEGILMEDGITVFIDLSKYEILHADEYAEEED